MFGVKCRSMITPAGTRLVRRGKWAVSMVLVGSTALTLSTCGDPTDTDVAVTSTTDRMIEESTPPAQGSTTPDPATSPTRTPTKSPTTSPPKSQTSSPESTPSTPTPSTAAPRSLSWIPFGPAAPDTPITPLAIYAQIQADCPRAVADGTYKSGQGDEALFWESAAEACVALREASPDAWRRASEAWFGGGREYATRNCYVDAVRETMQAIMGSTATPDTLPNVTLGASASGYACPPSGLDLSPRAGTTDTAVTLSWSGAPWMHYSGDLLFGTQRAALLKDNASSATVSPPDHAPGPVAVVLALDNGAKLAFGSYTYQ